MSGSPDAADAGWSALPDAAPLGMATQILAERPARRPERPSRLGRTERLPTTPAGLALRRLLVIGGAVLLTIGAGTAMNRVLNGVVVTPLGVFVVALFVVLFAWIALAFTSAVAGFVSLVSGGGLGLGVARDAALPRLATATALLMPTYNEDPTRVAAGLEAMIRSLAACGQPERFHVFVLSDTRDPAAADAEERVFGALRDRARAAGGTVFYRRRRDNRERKAGNVGEWVRRFGGGYPLMLTLDADSVMAGEAIVRMAGAMEANPGVGLIQTLPLIVGGHTLFARLQQFAGRVYGPVIAYGIAWWHGSEGNYWGHNALIRTQAFADCAGLPTLGGRKPFGGHILSHDFVEAALMRRRGWAIHMLPALGGSYEESPPSLTDIAIRDRRWAQGNLQHAKVLPARGLHWVSRLHMLMGIGSYITSPLWLVFLLAGIAISLQSRFVHPVYFGRTRTLFPLWPHVDPVLAAQVFVFTMAILLAPKLLGLVAALTDREVLRGTGGPARLVASILVETVLGGLVAPIAMLLQTGAVISILLGRDSGWNAQRRDDGSAPLREVSRAYWRTTAFGAVLAGAALVVSLPLMLWMLPVLIGLALAIPLVALTSSRSAGEALARAGLLLIPEERSPPAVLVAAAVLRRPPA